MGVCQSLARYAREERDYISPAASRCVVPQSAPAMGAIASCVTLNCGSTQQAQRAYGSMPKYQPPCADDDYASDSECGEPAGTSAACAYANGISKGLSSLSMSPWEPLQQFRALQLKASRYPFPLVELPGFLTHEECDRLVHFVTHKPLKRSETLSGINCNRTSTSMWLDTPTSTGRTSQKQARLLRLIRGRVAELVGHPASHMESLQVARYDVGQQFKAHYDSGATDVRRLLTVLLYLNDDHEGGETDFPHQNRTVRCEKGKAVLWYNLHDDGTVIYNSYHRALPVLAGVKWTATQWVYDHVFKK
ncbi:hypothetical protein WJX72_009493 [[Myrmecia] bisecta]|uniref:Fe2OG dioxygenase domain-containing protein n=1 Tax=[Myrmecia] bisecta TaxID=41462 RepID=A0AAW1Q805_9CHLO